MQDAISDTLKISEEAPERSVLGPILYTLYTADIPTNSQTNLSTFEDRTAILVTHENPIRASMIPQDTVHKVKSYLKK